MFSENNFRDRYYNGIDKELEKKNFIFYPIFLIKKTFLRRLK